MVDFLPLLDSCSHRATPETNLSTDTPRIEQGYGSFGEPPIQALVATTNRAVARSEEVTG